LFPFSMSTVVEALESTLLQETSVRAIGDFMMA
jgi:hypothetical protein